jgi:hypothetical protein
MYEDGYCIACHEPSEQQICDICWQVGYRMCSCCATVYELNTNDLADDFVCWNCVGEPDTESAGAGSLMDVQRRLEG